MSRPKVLLTGGSGFIGKNIIESFLSEKYEIISPGHKILDLTDTQAVDDFFKSNNITFVIHSACKPGHRNAKDLSGIYWSNTRMFFNLARHSDSYKKLIIIGSGAIYDMKNYQPRMSEDYFGIHIPSDEHGFSKYVCEKQIEHSKNIIDLRVFSIFGKHEDYAIRFISNMMCKCIFDLPLTMNQNRLFDFLYVDDLIPVIDFFIENESKYTAYNVTPDETVYLYDLAEKIKNISGKNLPIIVKQDGLALEYSGSNHRLKKEFVNWKPSSFDKSLPNLYSWYLKNKNNLNKDFLLSDK